MTQAPTVDSSRPPREVAPGVHVLEDGRVPLVPNIGLVEGTDAVLVIDTGLGPANGQRVLEVAQALAGGRRLLLTTTHFHPEHAFGASAFRGAAEWVCNEAQAQELAAKGEPYLGLFRGMSPEVAAALEGTELAAPDRTYAGAEHAIDLGGRTAVLRCWGAAHTKGDQVVTVPESGVLFTGDLAEERIFPIFPWFPPDDADIEAGTWVAILDRLAAEAPRVVVPGHGAVGDAGILRAVAGYMREVARRTAEGRQRGEPVEALAEANTAAMRAAHPDWDAPEWIGFATRYFAERPL